MKHIKSRVEAQQALDGGTPPNIGAAVLHLIANFEQGYAEYGGWEPEEHGWVVLLERPCDLTDRAGLQLAEDLLDAPIEGVEHLAELGAYAVIIIMGNDFGLGYVVPEALLTPAQRAALDDQVLRPWYTRPAAPAS